VSQSFKLAASNIAWAPAEDEAVAAVLSTAGFTGVEIAPTKRWESPIEATKRDIAEYRAVWEKRGLRVVAMQSLLFGRSDLQLFGTTVARRALREYLTSLIEMAAGLGATALVFGSPKNRQRKAVPMDEAMAVAAEFFREIGAVAMSRRCVVCIEPNPPAYECDFINTTAEAIALCEMIGSRGVRVQGDIGAILSMQEDPGSAVRLAGPLLGHFHVSEPALAEITNVGANEAVASALTECRYSGWVSIEMRAVSSGSRVSAMERAAASVAAVYGPSSRRSE
jgi:sugar phosphate isomerase/epimerase